MHRFVVVAVTGALACGAAEPLLPERAPPERAPAAAAPAERIDEEARRVAERHAQGQGRWGQVVDAAASPGGAFVVVSWDSPPSTCLCDKDKPWARGSSGVDRIDRRGEGRPRVTRLLDLSARAVAVNATHAAAASGRTIRIWAHDGGEPVRSSTTRSRPRWRGRPTAPG